MYFFHISREPASNVPEAPLAFTKRAVLNVETFGCEPSSYRDFLIQLVLGLKRPELCKGIQCIRLRGSQFNPISTSQQRPNLRLDEGDQGLGVNRPSLLRLNDGDDVKEIVWR